VEKNEGVFYVLWKSSHKMWHISYPYILQGTSPMLQAQKER